MKTIVLQLMLEGPRPCTILCFNVHTTGEHLNRNASIGQLLRHKSFQNVFYTVVCAQSRPKTLTKIYNKEVCQASQPLPLVNYVHVKKFKISFHVKFSIPDCSVTAQNSFPVPDSSHLSKSLISTSCFNVRGITCDPAHSPFLCTFR